MARTKGYDTADFVVEQLRTLNLRPHVAQNTSRRRSAIDRRTTRHPGCHRLIQQPARLKSALPRRASRSPGHNEC